jgi:hypothetical protein
MEETHRIASCFLSTFKVRGLEKLKGTCTRGQMRDFVSVLI